MHNYACSLLWTHSAITLHGSMKPCCRFDITDKTFDNLKLSEGFNQNWNGSQYNKLRERMLADEKIDGCKKCYVEEKASGHSMRTRFNEFYGKYIGTDIKLRFLELGFNTHCNLSCRMCDEYSSSAIHRIKNPDSPVKIGFDINVDDINDSFEYLETIKIVGGEPMLAKNHDIFLEKLINSKCNLSNLRIIYHTNCTVKPSNRIVEYWKKIKNIRIVLSIDGIGRLNEVQRVGHKWKTLLDTLEFYKSLREKYANIEIRMHSLITAINVMDVGNIYDFHRQHISEDFNILSLDSIHHPELLALRNMPQYKKDKAFSYISTLNNIPESKKQMLLGHIKMDPITLSTNDDIANDDFQKKIDEVSGQNIKDYL